jgi:thioredoxin 1
MVAIKTIMELKQFISGEKAVLVYFSHQNCSVCHVLRPKVFEMLSEYFPLMKPVYIDTVLTPEIPGQYGIFTVPTIICFFEGKETIRKSRHIGVNELKMEIERPYEIMVNG